MASRKPDKQTTYDAYGTGRVDVLLVEDSPTDAQLLCESLRNYPLQQFDIEHVETLAEAIALLAQRPFDVILLDLNLPDSRAMQTGERLVRAAPETPIIILTGTDDERLAIEAMHLGIQDYLVKEYSRGNAVGRAVRYAVERRRAQQAQQETNEQLQAQSEELQTQTEELQVINEALEQREARLKRSQEIAHLGSWELDLTTNELTWSDEAYRIFGLAPQEFGTTYEAFLEHVHPEDRQAVDDAYRGSVQAGRDGYEIEHRVIRRDTGEVRTVHEKGEHFRDATGRIIRSVGMVHDITERRRAEAALRELNATLETRVAQRTAELGHRARQLQKLTLETSEAEERERKRLAEILHDDLQQQLAAAKFHLGLLSVRLRGDTALQEAAAEVMGMLKDAIEKTRSLSHELSPALLYQGDFGEALEWLANRMQAQHGLVVHVETRGPVEVASDPIRAFLFRTAQEILFNIVKHARVAEATVRLQRRREQLWLTISDRGRGFDPQALEQAVGFGLLSIRERIELLGGRMKIRSAPGRGSTFLITAPDGEAGTSGAKTPVLRKARERLRVLLADDHEVVREGLALLLNEQEDIEVVGQAANGLEAVDLAHQLQPDVVVMDVAMPLMEGDEATRQIKRDMPRTRIVGLSMFEEPDAVEKMHEAGAERYMLKTAPAEELLAAIRDR